MTSMDGSQKTSQKTSSPAVNVAIHGVAVLAAVLAVSEVGSAEPGAARALSGDPATLSHAQRRLLAVEGWPTRVGQGVGIWVSVPEQRLRVLIGEQLVFEAPISTARRGVGERMGSLQTPRGWHRVVRRLGDGAPLGRVFRSRRATRWRWRPGDGARRDLVLSRVLLLGGEELGRNRGGDHDSYARHIYIHGTNDEANIGRPTSHGCIRMRNRDIVEMFSLIPKGTPVLISAQPTAPLLSTVAPAAHHDG